MSGAATAHARSTTALRICPFCEATCGLTLTIENDRVTGARGDREDVFGEDRHQRPGVEFLEPPQGDGEDLAADVQAERHVFAVTQPLNRGVVRRDHFA